LADIEAGNTWVSAQTLIKLAEVFEIEPFELLKPEKETKNPASQGEFDEVQALISRFSRDVTSVVQDSVEKAVKHVKKQYKIE
jgi:transcriptional regulator with XRE-family HTH domain